MSDTETQPSLRSLDGVALLDTSPQGALDHALDLKLLCADGASVLASSQLLMDSTRSPAIKDIVAKLRQENPSSGLGTPMELPVQQDSAEVWEVVWKLIEQPMAADPGGLGWENIEQAINLADKYHLMPALQACEAFILTAAAHTPLVREVSSTRSATNQLLTPGPFGYLAFPRFRYSLDLSFLEQLLRAQMHRAVVVLAPLYMHLLYDSLEQLRTHRRHQHHHQQQQQQQQGVGLDPAASSAFDSLSRYAMMEGINDVPLVGHADTTASQEAIKRLRDVRGALGSYVGSSSDPASAAQVYSLMMEQVFRVVEELVQVAWQAK